MSFFSSISSFAPSINSVGSVINVAIWGLVIGVTISVLVTLIKNKIKYKYVGEVFKRRQSIQGGEEPSSEIYGGKAGYFKNKKTKRTVFRIKYGLMPWHIIELNKLPDPKYMIGNKVYYQQLNKDNFVQAKMDVDWEGKFKLTPVEDDTKSMAMMDIYDKQQVLNTSKLTPITVGFVVMGVILVTGIVVFYFLGKA